MPSISDSLNDTLSAFYGPGVTQARQNMVDQAPDILSASTYPGVPSSSTFGKRKQKRKPDQESFGGYVIEGDAISTSMSASRRQSDDAPPPKKRARRTPKSDEEDSKKQRGRPRLDTQDETAADRRRTQIRLAQRAYRHRKETTISALKKRVSELEGTIDKMNKSFLEFHDNAIDSGLVASKPSLAQQLKATTEEFVSLAKIASIDSDHEEEAANIAELQQLDRAESPSNLEYRNFDPPQALGNETLPLGFEYSFSGNEGSDVDVDVEELPQYMPTDTSTSGTLIETNDSLKEWSFLNNYQQLNAEVHVPTFEFETLLPPIQKPLSASVPYTYSFQETTFARRLHRLCLERAFRVLTNPAVDPEYIKRAFRFTFSFSNRRRMLARFQELLKRKAGESLENWTIPFFHIGGAGTHFPRLDEHGHQVFPPNLLSPARAFGPVVLPTAEMPRAEATVEQLLHSIGFGGVWFDAHDVESYLRTKGIHLDGHSSFVEINPSTIDTAPPLLLHSSSSTSSISGASPPTTTNIRSPVTPTPTPPQTQHHHDASLLIPETSYFGQQELPDPFSSSLLFPYQQNKVPGLEFDVTMTAGRTTTTTINDQQQQQQQHWPSLPSSPRHHNNHNPSFQEVLQRTTQPVTIDVSKMLERMVDGSACLGRAPGFRRKDIDNALVMAVQEAF